MWCVCVWSAVGVHPHPLFPRLMKYTCNCVQKLIIRYKTYETFNMYIYNIQRSAFREYNPKFWFLEKYSFFNFVHGMENLAPFYPYVIMLNCSLNGLFLCFFKNTFAHFVSLIYPGIEKKLSMRTNTSALPLCRCT